MKRRAEEFKKLTLLLSDGDEVLSEEVVLSLENPSVYVDKHAKELKLRGIDKTIDGLSWVALVDGLLMRGKLEELDWKESPEMFVEAVTELLANAEDTEQVINELNLLKTSVEDIRVTEVLRQINQTLWSFGYIVVLIDLHSDSYPIALTRLDLIEEIIRSANRLDTNRIKYFQ